MIKAENFEPELQDLANFAKVCAHPARLMILRYLAEKQSCISGDITTEVPLSRTTVSQHLKELKSAGLIMGEVDGLKINYCLNMKTINKLKQNMNNFFNGLEGEIGCKC